MYGDKDSLSPSISNGGNLITFSSIATNLVPNDNDRFADIFLYDQSKNILRNITITWNNNAKNPVISGNGQYILFESAGGLDELALLGYEVSTSRFNEISINNSGAMLNKMSSGGSMNANGTLIAFVSNTTWPQGNASVSGKSIYVRDVKKKQTYPMSENDIGESLHTESREAKITQNGCCIVFQAKEATNLTDTNESEFDQIYLMEFR